MELRSLFHGPKPLFLFFLKVELIRKNNLSIMRYFNFNFFDLINENEIGFASGKWKLLIPLQFIQVILLRKITWINQTKPRHQILQNLVFVYTSYLTRVRYAIFFLKKYWIYKLSRYIFYIKRKFKMWKIDPTLHVVSSICFYSPSPYIMQRSQRNHFYDS
jgi:hypothetical protein